MATEAVGKLRVDLVANSAKFTAGITAAKSSLGGFAKNVRSISSSLAGLLGFGSIAMAIRSSIKELDAIGDTSATIGIAAEELQKLHFAAEQTGQSTESLDGALEKMLRNVSEAAQGTGEAKDAIEQLGLSAETLSRLTPDRMLAKIADAMADVKSQSDRVRIAMELFGRGGAGMVNVLADGSAGLKAFGDELEAMGGVLSSEAIKKIQEADDAINRMKFAVRGLVNELSAGLGPGLKIQADLLTNFIVQLRAMTSEDWRETGISGAFARAWETTDEQVTTDMARRNVVNATNRPPRSIPFSEQSIADTISKDQLARSKALEAQDKANWAMAEQLRQSVMFSADRFAEDLEQWRKLLGGGFFGNEFEGSIMLRKLVANRVKDLMPAPELSAFQGPTAAPALQRGTQAAITAARENADRLQANTDHVAATAQHAARIKTLVEKIVNDKQIPPEIFELPP